MQRRQLRNLFRTERSQNIAVVVLAIICAVLVIMAAGCGKKPAEGPVVVQSSATGTTWEIPAEQAREIPADPGKDADEVVGVIVVPPSEKPTTVTVYERPKTVKKQLKEVITGTKGSPDYTATSDNKDVKFTTTKDRGIWPWLVGMAAVAGGLFAVRKWLQRFSWVTKILGFFLKR